MKMYYLIISLDKNDNLLSAFLNDPFIDGGWSEREFRCLFLGLEREKSFFQIFFFFFLKGKMFTEEKNHLNVLQRL